MLENLNNQFWWFLAPQQWWLRHLLFWCYRFNNYIFYSLGFQKIDLTAGIYANTTEIILYLAFVYFHISYLIPKVLLKKKVFLYLIISICTIILFTYLEYYIYKPQIPSTFFKSYHKPFINAVETFLQVTGLRIMVEFLYDHKKIQELKSKNFETELAYLKNQINPHFLFNTLNNIAVQSEKYPEKVTDTIVQLSNVLRYQIYETDKIEVPLNKEIENIKQYLKLECLRLNDIDCTVNTKGDISTKKVSPMLFLPFIENTIKHSADVANKIYICVLFESSEHNITFTCINSKPIIKPKQIVGGIGLKNIERRLQLLYPDKHVLTLNETENKYSVELIITF
jgi:two-component system, LytTR family, sensor kinase